MVQRDDFEIGGEVIQPGERRTVHIPVSVLSDHTPAALSVHVIHGARPGPTLFVSAAIHGDEMIGVEIVRRLLRTPSLDKMKGTLLAIPVVNSFGFIQHSRYLPDRRDLNRSFPGSAQGSLAGRLAHLLMEEVIARSDFGIDLHSAAVHRTNLPQVRISPGNTETLALAKTFGAPLILMSQLREGSLRQEARKRGVEMLLFEAGEGLRFDEFAARVGLAGIMRVMHHWDMIGRKGVSKPKAPSLVATRSYWMRAPVGGLFRPFKAIGDTVTKDDIIGAVSDPFGEEEVELIAPTDGLMIGRSNMPAINEGDGLAHIARLGRSDDAEATLESLTTQLDADPLFDEDEIL